MQNRLFFKIIFAGLLMVLFTAFLYVPVAIAGYKKIVAVSRFENKSSWRGQWKLDDGMADQLTDALMQSGEFVVLERETLSDVLDEQDLASSGRAMKSKAARTGKVTSAQILIKGAITEFESKSEGGGSGFSIKGFRIGSKSGGAHVGLIIRLIDTTTGQVLDSKRVEGTAKSGGFKLGFNIGDAGFGTESFKKTPLGKATQIAIDNAVEFIAAKMRNLPFQGRVIKVSGNDVYLGAGEQYGASVGETFTVYRKGEELVDPDTGEILGSEEESVGTVKIFEVKEKYSKARAVSGTGKIKRGDIFREK
jgi:curli biogenesis system outer membrane secretion channel CsgG